MISAPKFWDQPHSLFSKFLAPLSFIYQAGSNIRTLMSSECEIDLPVICVGNAVVGGSGKTPCTIALALRLKAMGVSAHCISRGYGGNTRKPTLVNLLRHSSREVGDEPILLAKVLPTWVSRNKCLGAEFARKAGAETVVLDDGLQNSSIKKDLSFLVIDAFSGIGNGRILPAGPLREPLQRALSRAEATILLDGAGSGDDNGWLDFLHRTQKDMPVFHATLRPTAETLLLTKNRIVAFAGLGAPEKFFEMLSNMGGEVLETHTFPDHHRYRPDEVMHIVERAAAQDATPVTTAKDAVRLPNEARKMIEVAEVFVHFSNNRGIDSLLNSVMHKKSSAAE